MALLDTLTQDMKSAMKARESDRLTTLRMLIAGVKNARIAKGSDLTDDEELAFLATEAKRRRESLQSYTDAGREDLAEVEQKDLAVIEHYLPKQLTEDEVRAIIAEIMAETGASSKADMGKVMGKLMPQLRGRFDGGAAKGLVVSALS